MWWSSLDLPPLPAAVRPPLPSLIFHDSAALAQPVTPRHGVTIDSKCHRQPLIEHNYSAGTSQNLFPECLHAPQPPALPGVTQDDARGAVTPSTAFHPDSPQQAEQRWLEQQTQQTRGARCERGWAGARLPTSSLSPDPNQPDFLPIRFEARLWLTGLMEELVITTPLKRPWGPVGTQARSERLMRGAGQALGTPASPAPSSPRPHLLPLPFACSSLPGTSNRPRSLCSVWFIMQVCKYIIYYFPHHYPLFITESCSAGNQRST